MKISVLWIILILWPDFISSEVFVIGPRSIRFQENLKLHVINTEQSDEAISITLVGKNKGDTLYADDVEKLNFDQVQTEISLAEHPDFEDFTLIVEIPSKRVNQTYEITVHAKYSVIIQSDKNIYRPGDVIKFRALVLDSHTRPYQSQETLEQLRMSIVDASGRVVFKEGIDALSSTFAGVYFGEYETSATHSLGDWEIRAQLGEVTGAVKSIEVSERATPRFHVVVQSPSHILLDSNENLDVLVFGEYTFGEFVEGTATIKVTAYDDNDQEISKKFKSEKLSAKKTIKFNLKGELALKNSCTLVVAAVIREKVSNKTAITTRNVTVHESAKHKIELVHLDEAVKPGGSLEIRATVKKYDETIEESRAQKVKFTVKSPTSETVVEKNLVKGVADLTIAPPLSNLGVKVTAKYLRSSSSIDIARVPVSKNYLVIKANNRSPQLGDILEIQVESNVPISTFFTAISTQTETSFEKKSMGISKMLSFNIKLTKNMTPSFDVIAYYIGGTESVVFDRLNIKVQHETRKPKVDFNIKQVKPRDKSIISIDAAPNAFIGLMAVDNEDLNSFDQRQLFELLSGSAGSNGPTVQSGGFGNSNFFLIRSSLTTASRFGNEDNGRTPTVISKPAAEVGARKEVRFQKTWFFESFNVDSSGKSVRDETAPDQITAWTLTGFSLDREHGLAIADPKKLYVKKEFFIKAAQHSIRLGEVLKFEVLVYNYLPTSQSSSVTVTLSKTRNTSTGRELIFDDYDPEIFETSESSQNAEYEIVEKVSKCDFRPVAGGAKSKTVTASANKVTSTFFFVKPLTAGVMKLYISAVPKDAASRDARDDIEANVQVEYEGLTMFESKSFIINPSEAPSFGYEIALPQDVNINSVKVGGSLHYKLLGKSLIDVGKLMYNSNKTNEQTLESFASTLAAAKYLNAVKQFYGQNKAKALQEIKSGYYQVLGMKQRDNSYKLSGFLGSSTSIWLTAFVAKVFGLAAEFKAVDPDFTENALRYLSSKQGSDGGFESEAGTPQVIQGGVSTKLSMTAFVMIAFLENPDIAEEFPETVKKGIEYLDANFINFVDNFEFSIVAYALSLGGHKSANSVLKNLNQYAIKEDDKVYWNRDFGGERDGEYSDHVVNIETSAYALLASLKQGELLDALKIMNWLSSQRTKNGGFYSTQDTTIGIQAIAEASKLFYHPQINMNLTLSYKTGSKSFSARSDSVLRKNVFELPGGSRYFRITANGNGKALLNIWHSYKAQLETSTASFGLDLDVNVAKFGGTFYLNACLKSDEMHLMRLDVTLPSGYVYDHDSTPNLMYDDVRRVETHSNSDIVTMYFNRVDNNEICISFNALRKKTVESLKHSSVRFYKYDDPTKQTVKFYSLKGEQQCNL